MLTWIEQRTDKRKKKKKRETVANLPDLVWHTKAKLVGHANNEMINVIYFGEQGVSLLMLQQPGPGTMD